ncbi:MAG: Glycosyltransferase involved in cell wall bisynthesis [Verrucomicrobia bacterium]|jgi:glycosyltransferase involved in cell wall biosynthesis|nr:MAG: Glycosyltransferase involved in cell wall bisynthesis [Verrucomicrobiota bacterium]
MPANVSIVIPAFNEEALLPRTLSQLHDSLRQAGIEARIVVTDNNSTDATAELARLGGAEVVFEPVNQIARARNTGAAHAEGEFLIFVDADTRVAPGTLRQAVDALSSGEVCGGGALVSGETPFTGFSAFLVAFWTWLSRTRQLAAGAFVFCRRDAFEAVGGFDESVYAGEEVWFVLRLKQWGKARGMRFHLIEDPPIQTSPRKAAMFGSWQLFLQFLVVLVPAAARFRRLCWVWYQRR